MSKLLKWSCIVVFCFCVSTAIAYWKTGLIREQPPRLGADSGDVNDYQPVTVLRKAIRPIVDPAIASAEDIELPGNALVIGVEVNDKARAYPINQLTGPLREIINDTLGGTAIAATW